MMRRGGLVLALLLLVVAPVCGQLQVEIESDHATVGDPLSVRLTIEPGTDGAEPVRGKLGPDLGPFSVLDESWSEPADGEAPGWVWSATVAAFETGELEFPALRVATVSGQGPGWRTEPVTVEIVSVLEAQDEGEAEPELADLKDPASLAPDFAPFWLAAIVFAVFVGFTVLAWWLYRRYAARLAAAPVVEDPFARTPPHEWAFEALRDLLDRRADYPGDRFHARLSWILKRYLGGRFRIDLLEHTTDEVPGLLEQAGAPSTAVARIVSVLGECDAVKFAKQRPSETERKDVVDRVYGIVDQTKPVERTLEASPGAA